MQPSSSTDGSALCDSLLLLRTRLMAVSASSKIHEDGFLKDDTLFITASILSCQRQATASVLYDSKKETGYVGLKAQGANPVANPLLQMLYHIPYFRRAVYRTPITEVESEASHVMLELQRLFCHMQFRDGSADAVDLLESLGVGGGPTTQQQPPSSLTLYKKMEEKMKGTVLEGTTRRLFAGHMCKCISWGDLDMAGSFYELTLQLDVHGCKDLYASLDKYTTEALVEVTEAAGSPGSQAMKERVVFKDLPPVLVLQLKPRPESTSGSDEQDKAEDRYEFPLELDLDVDGRKYLTKDADASVRNLYELHSVAVQGWKKSCAVFIRPNLGDQWFKFDDERVTKEPAVAAIEQQYGGQSEASTVHMLVYVRKSDKQYVMCPVSREDLAPHVQERLARERPKLHDAAVGDTHIIVRVATEEDLRDQIGTSRHFDLVDFDQVKTFRMEKSLQLTEFRKEVAATWGVPEDQQHYWTFARRQNGSYRPHQCYNPGDNKPLETILADAISEQPATLDLLLTKSGVPTLPTNEGSLLFLKLYDPLEKRMTYAGSIFVMSGDKLLDALPEIRLIAGYLPLQALQVYEEINPSAVSRMCRPVDDALTVADCQLRTGDILWVQKVLSPDVVARCRFPNVPKFLAHVLWMRRVRFRQLSSPNMDTFVLELSILDTYHEVVSKVALQLPKEVAGAQKCDPSKIRLTAHDCAQNAPRWRPIHSEKNGEVLWVLDMFLFRGAQMSDILYYEVVETPQPAAKCTRTATVSLHDQRTEQVARFHVELSQGSTAGDVLKLVKAEPGCAHLSELCLTKIRDSRIHKVFSPTEVMDDVDAACWTLQAVETGTHPGPEGRLIPVCHVQRVEADGSNNLVTAFGHPFLLAVGDQETLASVKARVQAKLGVAGEEFAKWNFAIVVEDIPVQLKDNDMVALRYQALRVGRWDTSLGIEHPAKPVTTSNPRTEEPASAKAGAAVEAEREEPRVLRGLNRKRKFFSQTFEETSQLPPQDTPAHLTEALASHADFCRPSDVWQLAQATQNIGRALWASGLELATVRTGLRVTDEEGRKLAETCRQKEAVLVEKVARARETPLDGAALSARDQALEDHLASLRQLEEIYTRKAALAGERVRQKRRVEELSGLSTAVGGAAGPESLNEAQGPQVDDVHEALVLAGSALEECEEQLAPAAAAKRAAMEQLAKCLEHERVVTEGVREKLGKARDAGARVMGAAIKMMEGETPEEDVEHARVLQGVVDTKKKELRDVMAARQGLRPTEVRLGVLQRDLLEVRKQKALAKAHLEIAGLSEKAKEAEELRAQLDALEGRQREIDASIGKLTMEAQEAAQKLAQYYPEAAVLPERANRLSKALPGSAGKGSDDIIDPDWSLACFRDGMGQPLGSSKVRVVEDREGCRWVIKELCQERELRREGGRLQALQHPLVIRLERIFFDRGVAYLQMPFCKNGSLRAWFERIKARTLDGLPLGLEERQQVWATMRQVFQAVAFIHRKGVVHRDLKPENILLQDDGQIALCDFGVSHDVSRAFQTTLATQLGGFTTAYAAPEVLTSQPSAKQWPFAQDMWSLGVMLLEIQTGSLPLWNVVAGRLEDAQGRPVAVDASSTGGPSQGDPWTIALRGVTSSLLQVDPAGRPSAEDALSDPHGFLARDLTQVAVEQQRRMHALSSFLESLRRCPVRVAGRAHLLKVTDLDNRPQLVREVLEVFQADGLDLRVVFSVECGGIRVPLSEVLDRFFQAVVLPEVGLFEQGREGREDVLPPSQLQEGVAFLPKKASQHAQASDQHMKKLRAMGKALAKAILECLHVPVSFATALCCFLVGDEQLADATPSRCLELMAEFDPVVARQMRGMLAITHGSGQEHAMMASMLTRCAAKDDFAITDANKGAVVRQAVQLRLFADRREELCALREGFLSLDDLMADHLKLMTGEVLVTLFFGQDYLDVDTALNAFVFPEEYWGGAANKGLPAVKEWLQRFIREVSETGLRLLCLRALGSVNAFQSGHKCSVLPGGKERELPAFERETGCMYMPEGCSDFNAFQARMHRALRAGEYGVRTGAQQEERLARGEMDAVVGAMRGQVRAGGWYRCPNGHPYAIGDCGGAMAEARCPVCGAGIGGRQHRIRGDNQNALDIDGAAAPAWN
eukprot:jgi/Mesvir1/1955/Mv12440-RA.3